MNIPTAEEFLGKNIDYVLENDCKNDVENAMIEFAKLHVEAARKEFKMVFSEIDDVYPFMKDDKLSDIYPLTNIK
jgi:hypothetical protein